MPRPAPVALIVPLLVRAEVLMVRLGTELINPPLPTVTPDAVSVPEDPRKLSVPFMVAEPDAVTAELIVTFSVTLAGRTMVGVNPPPGRLAAARVKLPPTACPVRFSVKLWLSEPYD